MEIAENGPRLNDWLQQVDQTEQGTVDFLINLNRRLNQDIAYTTRMEPGVQTAEETLELAIGSCRDSGWLLVQILRHFGLASRFVSGYLAQVAPDVQAPADVDNPIVNSLALHAWAEVYIPGAGWIGLDPTSECWLRKAIFHSPAPPTLPEPLLFRAQQNITETTLSYINTLVRLT